MNDTRPLIEMKNIDLIFGTFQALKDVSVSFDSGELVGLVGDNGAGKTTLIRILCGMHAPTNGEVYFDGQKINRFNPRLAIDLGIETIQQAVGLCNNLSIARNFYLGREPVKRGFFKNILMLPNKKHRYERDYIAMAIFFSYIPYANHRNNAMK